MVIYSKVTEIFCLVDEFCKGYSEIVDKSLISNKAKRTSIMPQSEVITLAVNFNKVVLELSSTSM